MNLSVRIFKDYKMFERICSKVENLLFEAISSSMLPDIDKVKIVGRAVIYQQNPEVLYYHFGDIDAGGFYILEHLKRQTGIEFQPYKMDLETLKEYQEYSKRFTDHDRDRLMKLRDSQYQEVISYMLKNNCKLEQEAINMK